MLTRIRHLLQGVRYTSIFFTAMCLDANGGSTSARTASSPDMHLWKFGEEGGSLRFGSSTSRRLSSKELNSLHSRHCQREMRAYSKYMRHSRYEDFIARKQGDCGIEIRSETYKDI